MPKSTPAITRAYLDNIADEQLVDTDVVVALTGSSRSTTYRWEAQRRAAARNPPWF